jgi:hypothetical protein
LLLYEIAVVEGNTVPTGFRIKSAGFWIPPSRPLGLYRNEPQAIGRKQNTPTAPVEQTDSIWFIANLTFLKLNLPRHLPARVPVLGNPPPGTPNVTPPFSGESSENDQRALQEQRHGGHDTKKHDQQRPVETHTRLKIRETSNNRYPRIPVYCGFMRRSPPQGTGLGIRGTQ